MTEKNIQSNIMLAVSQAGGVVFRNNVGRAVAGDMQRIATDTMTLLRAGDWVIRHGRPVEFGVCNPGGSDLIGWRSMEITPEMVGCRVAVFLALEVKTAKGRIRDEQQRFIQAVRLAGGLAGVVRSPDEAVGLMNPLEALK